MMTLSRAITAHFFPDSASYTALVTHWHILQNSLQRQELTAAHHLLYLALRGKNWQRAFTPLTNTRKLAKYGFYDWGLFRAQRMLHSLANEEALLTPFAGFVTPAMLAQVRELIPLVNPYSYQPEQFTCEAFPFEAYQLPLTLATTEGKSNA